MIAAVCVRWLEMVTTASSTARTEAITPTLRPSGSFSFSCSWWISSSAIVDFRIIEVRMPSTDEQFMREALALAGQSAEAGEVPVGAIVVVGGAIAGVGSNASIALSDPTAHAEILAIRQAAARLANYRLTGATLYCTLEPCVMCGGALVAARVQRLVFGARDLRFGGVRSKFQVADSRASITASRGGEGARRWNAWNCCARFSRLSAADKRRRPQSSPRGAARKRPSPPCLPMPQRRAARWEESPGSRQRPPPDRRRRYGTAERRVPRWQPAR